MTYNQPTKMPTRKVTFTAIGGGVASIGMGVWAVVSPETYTRVPPGMESGIATLLAFGFGYFTRESV